MTNLKNEGPCYVYGLLDPRSATVFYIGTSLHPERRLFNHRHEKGRCRAIIRDGFDPQLIIFHKCDDRNQALRIEYRLLEEYPALINKQRFFSQITGKHCTRPPYRPTAHISLVK